MVRERKNLKRHWKEAREKREYANPNSILIDDLEKNIKGWRYEYCR